MRNTARTANINRNDWTTCLPATEYSVSAPDDFIASVTVYGSEAMTHDADETRIVSATAGRKALAVLRQIVKDTGYPLEVTEYAPGDCCLCCGRGR